MVNLIGQRVVSAVSVSDSPLSLSFENGSEFFALNSGMGARSPEAFQFIGSNNQIVVEQNA